MPSPAGSRSARHRTVVRLGRLGTHLWVFQEERGGYPLQICAGCCLWAHVVVFPYCREQKEASCLRRVYGTKRDILPALRHYGSTFFGNSSAVSSLPFIAVFRLFSLKNKSIPIQ